jgi:MFS family permease
MSSTVEPSPAIETAPIEDTSLLAFYRDMNLAERRTFWACAGGWALDGMDFMIYPLVIGTIIALWKVDPGTAGLAGTVTLLASAVGGWLGGYLADRIGRVRTLQLTILWFSFFSLVCAVVQNFDQLLIARAVLGLGFGGEWAAGAVLMGEAIRPQYRGRAVGSVQSGWAVGWGLAVLSQAILFSYVPPEIAWRWMFAIGALPALLVFYLRRHVREPEIAAATRAKQLAAGDRPALWEIFSGPILKTTILASLMATGCQGGYYAITFWVPRFLTTERKLSVVSSTGYLAALIIGSFIGYLVGAWLADRIGRRNLFPDLLDRRHRGGPALYAVAADQRGAMAAGLPARLLRFRLFLRRRRVPHRTLSDQAARIGPGLLLQFRPRHRRAVSVSGRGALDRDLARQCHRDFRGSGLRRVLHRGLCIAGNARASAACGCVEKCSNERSVLPPALWGREKEECPLRTADH